MTGAIPPAAVPLRFELGMRTLLSVSRRLERVPLSLADALADAPPALAPVPADADGRLVTSLPVGWVDAAVPAGSVALVRQRYRRSWTDLTIGDEAWWAARPARARATLARKRRRAGDAAAVCRYATPDEIAAFLPLARAIAARTYQERLPGGALPGDAGFMRAAQALAAADRVRGWLLFVADRPVAYLFCTAQAGDPATLRYDHLGHDPAHAGLSPGTLLQLAAMRDLLVERRFARFDFLEGDGRHKRLFATGAVDCCDVLALRRTIANRALAGALGRFDAGVARAGASVRLRRWTRALRR